MTLALITSARIGELLTLRWDQCEGESLLFLKTKNGRARRIPISPTMNAVQSEQPKTTTWVFANPRTGKPYTTGAASFRRALERAGITTGDVTPHTLRHTVLSRMLEAGVRRSHVMAISGHSSTRMLARYAHPTEERKVEALESFRMGTNWLQRAFGDRVKFSGPQGTRTLDLRVANAALSQLS